MQAYGSDRVRTAGGKILLYSPVPKGWTARVAKTLTSAEHPGTAVLWEDQYFEVVSAEASAEGGVRYVLALWPEAQTIRLFEHYDADSEARRVADYKHALAQQKGSLAASLAGILLGHLPAPVQRRIANEYGVSPARMTLISCIPIVVLFGTLVWLAAGGRLGDNHVFIPIWLWIVSGFLMSEAGVRFNVAMAQDRGMGSILGLLAYSLFWLLAPNRARLVSPLAEEKGMSTTFYVPPPDAVAERDAISTRGAMFTLLSPGEQQRLAQRYGYDYRRDANGIAIIILGGCLLGVISSWIKFQQGRGSALISLVIAALLALEQIVRLRTFKSGPAGSILGALVRPFVRGYLR